MSFPPRLLRSAGTRCMLGAAAFLLLAPPHPASAQELTRGSPQIGVRTQMLDQHYLIDGATGREILAQMGALGPGGRWTQFGYRYSWTRTAARERLPNGSLSNLCSLSEFGIQFDFNVRYPRWVRPEGAPDRVAEAWAQFSEDLVVFWERYRDDLLDRAKTTVNQMRFYEEVCTQVDVRLQDLLRQAFGEPQRGREDEDRPVLRWPPEGFEDVMQAPAGGIVGRRGESSAGSSGGTAGRGGAAAAGAAGAGADAPGASASSAPRTSSRGLPAFDEALESDFQIHGARELIFGILHQGTVQFREAYGPAERMAAGTLEPDAVFGSAGFTEILIAATASSLASRGLLDLDAPVSNYLPTLPDRLGSVTLDQLLTHRTGLDNALPVSGDDWSRELDVIRGQALFTEPGAVFSYSRYSYPLAARVIERATRVGLEEALARVVTVPLGLESTSFAAGGGAGIYDGVPLALTTLDDVNAFWLAWMAGEIPGSGPASPRAGLDTWPGAGQEDFLDGYWRDRVGGVPRIRVTCGAPPTGYASGLHVFPETRSLLAYWARYEDSDPERAAEPPSATRWPAASARFLLGQMQRAVQVGEEIYGPSKLIAGGELTTVPRRCPEPFLEEEQVQDLGEPAPAADWPGRYANGDSHFVLGESGGLLTNLLNPDGSGFAVRHLGEDVFFTQMNPPGAEARGFAFRLINDASGRRYVVIDDRAYVHESDVGG